MTVEQGSTPDEEPVVTGEAPATGPAELREAYNREKAKNAKLTEQVMGIRLGEIGLSPNTGLGKAIAKEYDGELTAEAIAEYARSEYGHEGSVQTATPELAAAQRIDQTMGVGEPVPPPPGEAERRQQLLREAAAAGDTKASIALKLSQQQE